MSPILVISSFPDAAAARQIGTALVQKQLVACVSLIPSVESIYRWQGKVETAPEVVALIKTTRDRLPAIETEICALHPYDVPEVIALEISGGLPDYLAWIAGATPPSGHD